MGIFNKDPVRRLDEKELRDIYLESKRSQRIAIICYMFLSVIGTIAIITLSLSYKVYWILIFSIILILCFIRLITVLSRVIEEIFENREV
jgi:hypothetical protein